MLVLCSLACAAAGFSGSVLVLALPAVAHDFGARLGQIADLGSVLALGAVGAVPAAWAADRLGRRRVVPLAVACFSLADLGSGLAPSLAILSAFRLLAVASEIVALAVATAVVVEEFRSERRGAALAATAVSSGLGFGLATLAYPALAPDWRLLFLAGGLGLPLALVILLGLPESAAWADAPAIKSPVGRLVRPPWRSRLIIVAGVAILSAALYRPATLLVALHGSRDLNLSPTWISAVIVISGIVTAPAYLAGGAISDRWGRRTPAVALGIASALFTALTFGAGIAGYWAGSVGWSLWSSAQTPVIGAWFGELFPTRARATAETAASVAGALGGVAGLQLLARLETKLSLGGAVAALAILAVGGSALLLVLPDTAGEPLPP
ncbi:MAG TPA: MFS transporter [Candidatus Acidoferrales bacterium]|nr:MFS transporter [Candidatus Acidoferrales bacterium]